MEPIRPLLNTLGPPHTFLPFHMDLNQEETNERSSNIWGKFSSQKSSKNPTGTPSMGAHNLWFLKYANMAALQIFAFFLRHPSGVCFTTFPPPVAVQGPPPPYGEIDSMWQDGPASREVNVPVRRFTATFPVLRNFHSSTALPSHVAECDIRREK